VAGPGQLSLKRHGLATNHRRLPLLHLIGGQDAILRQVRPDQALCFGMEALVHTNTVSLPKHETWSRNGRSFGLDSKTNESNLFACDPSLFSFPSTYEPGLMSKEREPCHKSMQYALAQTTEPNMACHRNRPVDPATPPRSKNRLLTDK
jgi:hypothetical protein